MHFSEIGLKKQEVRPVKDKKNVIFWVNLSLHLCLNINSFILTKTIFMKQFVLFFALLISMGYGCYKADDLQTSASSLSSNDNQSDAPVVDRGPDICCMQLGVATTFFGGAEICGVVSSANSCTAFTNSCGTSSGFLQTVVTKPDHFFCVESGKPFKVTNTGGALIRIFIVAPGGNSVTVPLPPGASQSFSSDCLNPVVTCN